MKRLLIAVVLLSFTVIVDAQVRKLSERENFSAGSFEAGLNADIGLNTIEKNASESNYIYINLGDERRIYLGLSASLGYYILDGLSVEPKLGLNFNFDEVTALIAGRVCYTFNNESRSTYPYLTVGYGVTDYINNSYIQAGLFESLNYKVVTAGAGLKFMQSFHRAFILGLSYSYIYGTDGILTYAYMSGSIESQPMKTTMSLLSLFFGYSFEI